MVLKVSVFERRKTDYLGDLRLLGIAKLSGKRVLLDAFGRTLDDHIDQLAECQQTTVPSPERLPIRSVDGSIARVFKDNTLRGDSGLACGTEDLLEMQPLPHVDEVENLLSFEILHSVLDSGQIPGCIQRRTIGLE